MRHEKSPCGVRTSTDRDSEKLDDISPILPEAPTAVSLF
jgi:hypothetical protein